MARFGSLGTQFFDDSGDQLPPPVSGHPHDTIGYGRAPQKPCDLTQAELRRLVHYDLQTGDFTRIRSSGTAKVGDLLGYQRPDGYLMAQVHGYPYLLHRLAWLYVYGVWPEEVDHLNHDRSDNRLANLREVTSAENKCNQRRRQKTKVTGVYWNAGKGMWDAKINKNKQCFFLGRLDDWFEAVCARKAAESRLGFHENHGSA